MINYVVCSWLELKCVGAAEGVIWSEETTAPCECWLQKRMLEYSHPYSETANDLPASHPVQGKHVQTYNLNKNLPFSTPGRKEAGHGCGIENDGKPRLCSLTSGNNPVLLQVLQEVTAALTQQRLLSAGSASQIYSGWLSCWVIPAAALAPLNHPHASSSPVSGALSVSAASVCVVDSASLVSSVI